MHRGLHSTVIPLTFAQHHSAVHSLRSASARKRSPRQGRLDSQGKRARGMKMFNSGCSSSFAKWICLSLALALALFSATPTRAQVSGATLSGLITDENGGPGPDAAVTIKNVGTGVTRGVVTNSNRFYSPANLPPASYEVRVTAKGFQTLVQKEITLTLGAQPALYLTLN